MSLFDKISTATGATSQKYARGGRHLVSLNKVFFLEPHEMQGSVRSAPLLGFSGNLIHSNRPDFNTEGGHGRGDEITVNDGCRFLDSALARFRRGLASAKMVKFSLNNCDEATLGLTRGANESDKEFYARIAQEAKTLCGPEQPLVGALVVFDCTERQKKDGSGVYTLFEVRAPTKDDLIAAGLIPA